MPADHSKTPSSSKPRRARKDNDKDELDGAHSREIELKRSRGEISCAECRRLKIRCDKTIPCQSCQRRGCAALCPNGSLATGQGTRFVLAATEHLHKRIAKMGERIRQLEDALAILQAKHSNEPHPLLRDDTPVNMEKEDDGPISDPTSTKTSEVIEAFGTLSVYEHGVSRFFGPSGGTEYLLYTDSESTQGSPSVGSKSPESYRDSMSPPSNNSDLIRFSAAFPFTPMGPTHAVMEMLEKYLPTWDRACHLSEQYLQNAAWLFRGVSKDQLLLEMLPAVYRRPLPEGVNQSDYSGPHDYALLYLIFALGAVVDLKQDPYNAEGEHYHQLARAALVLQPILEKPSVVTIQALHLLSIYNGMSGNEVGGNETSLETTWSLVAFAAQLSHSIGLHRDSARWGLPQTVVNRRRLLFWNLFVADSWQSLMTGRPPSFSREYIDCKFPNADDESLNKGDPEQDFGTWGFRFALQCVAEVASRTLTAETPSYETIMELDRKVRDFPIPAEAAALLEDVKGPPDPDDEASVTISMVRFVLSHSREGILLSIHRVFFAQAIIDCPENPLRSQYAPSFLAAYRAACTILKAINSQFAVLPTLVARFWVVWTYAFSSAVVFGTVVTRGPQSPLAKTAMTQLDIAYELFTKASKISRRAARALPILTRLKDKAHYAMTTPQVGRPDGTHWSILPETDVDELEVFAGKTMLVEASKRPSPSPGVPPASDFPPLHVNTGHFEQSYTPPIISPPSAPPIPRLPEVASDNTWYNQAYPMQYSSSSHQDPSGRSDYSMSPSYNGPPPAYQQSQQWMPPHSLPSHQMQPQPQSHTPPRVQLPQLPQLPQQPPLHPTQHTSHGAPVHAHHQQLAHRNSLSNLQYPEPGTAHYHNHRAPAHPPQPQSQPPPPHPGYIPDRSSQTGVYQPGCSYPNVPPPRTYVPPEELVNLGLASRESRLDERWTSFMHESGYLDGTNFRP
ncbi:hypothetical protein K474DRAFT_1664369 [Panus rudis PR-1116 ss-1]|nr:hypothetical protein K474DRAFT_1664369 [Panus rudis PR-1116 ss-1]